MSIPELPFELSPQDQILAQNIIATYPIYANTIFKLFILLNTPEDAENAFNTMKSLFGMTPADVLADQPTLDLLDTEPFMSVLFILDADYQTHISNTLGAAELQNRLDMRTRLFPV